MSKEELEILKLRALILILEIEKELNQNNGDGYGGSRVPYLRSWEELKHWLRHQ